MKTRDAFFKIKRLKDFKHFVSYSEYVKKYDGQTIQTVNNSTLLDFQKVYNEQIKKQIDGKAGGQMADMGKSLIMSIPPQMEKHFDRSDKKQMEEFVEYVVNEFLEGVKAHNKDADIQWLKDNMAINLHFDTEHTHFHCVVPSFIKSNAFFGADWIKVDYQKRAISYKTRRGIYNYCQRLLKAPELTLEELIEIQKKEKRTPKARTKKQLRDALEKSLMETLQEKKDASLEKEKAVYLAEKAIEENQKWLRQITNKIGKLERLILSGDYTKKELDKNLEVLKGYVSKTQDTDIKKVIENEIDNVVKKSTQKPSPKPMM
jgi:hypothetical protein